MRIGTRATAIALGLLVPLGISGAECAVTHTIAQIQDVRGIAPLADSFVTTRGIVTARKTNGFFVQMPSAGGAAPGTSQGLFVSTVKAPPAAAAAGNEVCVSGQVQPAGTGREIAAVSQVAVMSAHNPLPEPVSLTPSDLVAAGGLEKYEGMRVRVGLLAAVGPTGGSVHESSATATSNGFFYGVIAGISRPFREPGISALDPLPAGSPCCIPRWDGNPEILGVDSNGQPGAKVLNVAAGAVVSGLVGPLDYTSGVGTILPDPGSRPTVALNGLRSAVVPAPASSEFTVACLNLEHFFSDSTVAPAAFAMRLNKASLAIREVLRYPDVLGVEEVDTLATLQALAERLNGDAAMAGDPIPGYRAYLEPGNDPSGINVGLLVKTSRVTVAGVAQVGKDARYVEPDGRRAVLNDRPPLVLLAAVGPVAFTTIVNHLRSLDEISDPVEGARVRAKREAQAEFLARYLQSRMDANPGENLVSIGDYNAFEFSDGYVDVMGVIEGVPAPARQVVVAGPAITHPPLVDLAALVPPELRYSYSFAGSAQVLDHILVNRNLLPRVSRFVYAHSDADFPEVDRNDATRPERISDHDAAVAYFTAR